MTPSDTDSGFFAGVPSDVELTSGFVGLRRIYASQNGMCDVYLARRDGKLFILKTLREHLRGDAVALAALRKEYDAGFAVDHPAVVRTYDLVDVPSLGTAIILEYVAGVTLTQVIDDAQTLTPGRLCALLTSLCDAIAAIHAAGIVHRDIKPSNIIVADSGAPVRLIDFGCADSAVYTRFKEPAGTPRYTPADARSGDVRASQRLDLYALGVTISQLAPLCSSARYRRRLSRLSDALVSDAPPLLEQVSNSLDFKSPRPLRLLLFFLMAVVVSVLVFFFALRSNRLADSPAATVRSAQSLPVTQPSVVAESQHVEPQHTVTPQTAPSQSANAAGVPSATPVPVVNEQTVYASKFSSNPLDKYAVDLTDDYCQSLVDSILVLQQRGDVQGSARLRSQLEDVDAIVNLLTDSVLIKFPDAPYDIIRQIVAIRYRQFISASV